MAMDNQDSVAVASQGPTPVKFSRYRSVRRAASNNVQQINTSVPPVPNLRSAPAPIPQNGSQWNGDSNTTIKKSMSRYRRQKPPSSSSDAPHNSPLPVSVPTKPLTHTTQAVAPLYDEYPAQRPGIPDNTGMPKAQGRFMNALRLDTRGKKLFSGNKSPTMSDQEYEERERHRQEAMDRLTGGCPKSSTSSTSQRPTTRGRAATNREAQRGADSRGQEEASRRYSSNETKRRSLREAMKFSRPKEKASSGSSSASPVEPSSTVKFPGIDAPVSAVNAGERSVLVYYRKASLKLGVNPSTSAQDILVSASTRLSREIDPPRFILLESFTETGLERPLRRFEYVRDVMNSWAHDGENALIVVPAASLDALASVETQNVPIEPPPDATFHLYYSQRPRKWDKRYVTLRSDGQVVMSKKENGKDQSNICHLSDFDIYSPTPVTLSQSVKPPKKLCFAVKSQQKSSMFLSTENFVHFFSTNDKAIADGWYRAVQTWRSWYLVNKLGAGRLDSNDEAESSPARSPADASSPRSFKPLLGSLDFEIKESQQQPPPDQSRTQQLFSRKRTSRDHGPPPTSFPKSLAGEGDSSSIEVSDGSPFASAGLLGRTYTLRQKAMKEREEREKRENDEIFKQGLVGSAGSRRQFSASGPGSRSNTMTSAQQPDTESLLKRSQSTRQGKPLVDLTPVFQEPPQHVRKGKGITVDPSMPLIEAATGPELASGVAIPPSKTWRRPVPPAEPTTTPEVRTRNRSNTARSVNNRHRGYQTAPASPTSSMEAGRENPFAPNSLLARTGHPIVPQGGPPIGHGVATGDRNAPKPMLDMSDLNPFAEGSLLRGL